jgi:outer membrane protein OmpA-like peptidoglycan-associated protein
MKIPLRLLGAAALLTLVCGSARAQTSPATIENVRPATTTAAGDTGLWYVPTAETLRRGAWSASGYRESTNYVEGFSNVADFAATFAIGVTRRLEAFGSWKLDTRIDRDLRPLFSKDQDVGGVIPAYPFLTKGWSGNSRGDALVGLKLNLLSEADQKSVAVALRGAVKLPTGSRNSGVSTGKADGIFDFVVSKDAWQMLELSGYAGAIARGAPDGVSESAGFRWGFGAGVPSHSPIRITGEVNGEKPFDGTVAVTVPIVGADGSAPPPTANTHSLTAATLGVTWQFDSGIFLGAGGTWNMPSRDRSQFTTDTNKGGLCYASCPIGDFADFQFRIGFHPGVRVYTAPPPPPQPPPPAPPAINRPPTVTARCEPCAVPVGGTAAVTADAQDPDGDTLRYRWSAPSGSFANQVDRQTRWAATQQPGPVVVTVTVDDGKGGTANASTTIQVLPPPPVVELNFEDVYFDFDRSTLRPEALRLLDDAVAKLQANPTRNIIIEGHTCNIGTAEYNLALGERRADSVRSYLTSRGVAPNRLEVRSYGEERPKYDNSKEETRRLNRRAVLTLRVQ